MDQRVVAVALPLPVLAPFSYAVPALWPLPEPGSRVLVPFSGRRVIGVVTGEGDVPPGGLKEILEVLDLSPLPPEPLLKLAAWMADHYLAPPGECYRLLLPPSPTASRALVRLQDPLAQGPVADALRRGPLSPRALGRALGSDPRGALARLRREGVVAIDQQLGRAGHQRVKVVRLVGEGSGRGTAQAAVLSALRDAGGSVRLRDLVRAHPSWRGAVASLTRAGVLEIAEEVEARRPATLPALGGVAPRLTAAQEAALERIEPALVGRRFETFLLQGVTGSGKTEVYLRAAARALELGRAALILVPEIALTPFLVRAATERFGRAVSVLHSELGEGERHDEWWRIRDGESRVVVGARSALFAPLKDLGLIVVDEEHEASYKQEESPRYHARNAAVMRGQLEGAVVLLGSATPSLESSTNAARAKYTLLLLPERVRTRALPSVEVVDRKQVLREGGEPILTPPLREALAQTLGKGEQALLLLNRRGYATSLVCRECGSQALCPNCSVCLTLHDRGRSSLCHYCGHRANPAATCPSCGGEYLRLTGYGTERVLEAVKELFPSARVDRLDRDRTSRRGELERVLVAFEEGRTDVLVGTQMIAKGHDFPNVTLVGVVDADVGLGLPDFRAAERTFQLLTQVAGRAGRGDRPGHVILQTHLPDHYALRSACAQDYAAFFAHESEFRRTMGYPPAAALVNLVFRSADAAKAQADAEAVARELRGRAPGRFRVLGSAPAPLSRLKGEHRYQVLLKGDRAGMRSAVREVLDARFSPQRWPGVAVDVDPVSVL
jgi:primosomal protein N' (replication factor Y)